MGRLGWEDTDSTEHQWPVVLRPLERVGIADQRPLSDPRAVPALLSRESSQGRQNFKFFRVILFYFILHKWKQKLVSRVVWSFPSSQSASSPLFMRWGWDKMKSEPGGLFLSQGSKSNVPSASTKPSGPLDSCAGWVGHPSSLVCVPWSVKCSTGGWRDGF